MPGKDEEIIVGVVITIFVFLILGFFILILVAYFNQRKKRHLEEKEEMRLRFEKELMRTQLEIQEQTMKTISQEIHDNIGQVLSLAKLTLNFFDANVPDTVKDKIDSSRNLIGKAIKDLRDLSKSLNTDYIEDMGLARAIEYETEMLRKSGRFEVSLLISGNITKPDKYKSLIVFRIIQELLTNIIKHSNASHIAISLYYREHQIDIQLRDNGDGFDMAILEDNAKGIGIRNMYNRATLIGARMNLQSQQGKGTNALIVLPH